MSNVIYDEWDRAFEEGKKIGREQAIRDCINNIDAYVNSFHNHVGDLTCLTGEGDTCDMSAAVRVAVNRLKAMQ